MRIVNNYISADCVIFGFDFENLNVLLVDRTVTDSKGSTLFSDKTLIGSHVYEDETLDEAASRVLFDLTGLYGIYLEQFKMFSRPDRLIGEKGRLWLEQLKLDPDKRIITAGYFSLLYKQDLSLEWKGRNVTWVPVHNVGTLGFDHNQILNEALVAVRQKLLQEPIGFELLPQKFTLSQLQKVYEIILDTTLDKRNFRKKVNRMKYLVPLDEKQKGVAHKPAQLFMFNRDVYEKTKKDFFDVSV